jgi:hypothetical protein
MAITYQGKITPADVRKAIIRNYSKFRLGLSAVLIGLAGLWMVYSIITFPFSEGEILFWAAVLIIASMDLWLPFLYARRTNRAGSIYRYPIQGTADENGITVENCEIQTESVWSAFTRYKIFNEMVLLFRGKSGMIIFTLDLFVSEPEWQNFKVLVKTKMSRNI